MHRNELYCSILFGPNTHVFRQRKFLSRTHAQVCVRQVATASHKFRSYSAFVIVLFYVFMLVCSHDPINYRALQFRLAAFALFEISFTPLFDLVRTEV